jgi:hypothetical protein
LTVNVGKVYREYLEGARQRYFSPIRYSIWIMTLMVAIAVITDTVLIDLSQYQFAEPLSSPELQKNLDTFQAVFNSLIIASFFCLHLWSLVLSDYVSEKKSIHSQSYICLHH